MLLGLVGLQGNDVAGADVHALVAGLTLVLVHLGHAVDDMDGVEGADLLTGAHAQAAVVAAQRAAAGEAGSRHAVVDTDVLVLLVVHTAAGAVDGGHHLDAVTGGHAHDLTDLGSHSGAAGGALVDGRLTLHHGGSVAAAAGEAAAAAVGAGQAAEDGLLTGVHLNGEHPGSEGQHSAEYQTQSTQDQERN